LLLSDAIAAAHNRRDMSAAGFRRYRHVATARRPPEQPQRRLFSPSFREQDSAAELIYVYRAF